MKKLISIFLLLFCTSGFGADHEYSVSGEDAQGNSLSGTIYSNNGEKEVTGEVEDDKGNIHEFNGEWNDYGQVTGETGEGVEADLDTD